MSESRIVTVRNPSRRASGTHEAWLRRHDGALTVLPGPRVAATPFTMAATAKQDPVPRGVAYTVAVKGSNVFYSVHRSHGDAIAHAVKLMSSGSRFTAVHAGNSLNRTGGTTFRRDRRTANRLSRQCLARALVRPAATVSPDSQGYPASRLSRALYLERVRNGEES